MIRPNNVVIVSDTHCGCKMGSIHPDGLDMDEGAKYVPSPLQLKVYEMWRYFWDVWVPDVCHKEPFILVFNGDAIDGVHHNSVTQITSNLEYQRRMAVKLLEPVVHHPLCAEYYHIRGTEAHGGQSGQDEEAVAKALGAIPNEVGQSARYELYLRVGKALVHIAHHIGTSGSSAYESTAVNRELIDAYTEAGRWNAESPNFCARSHRHRNMEVRIPTALGYGTSFVTAGWQLKTPFTFRLGTKAAPPQIGGSIIRQGDEDVYSRHKVWSIERPAVVGDEVKNG